MLVIGFLSLTCSAMLFLQTDVRSLKSRWRTLSPRGFL
jgi:hypothetical protein